MLLNEICLIESVDFNVVFWNKEGEYWSANDRKVEKKCENCEGTGKDEGHTCQYCEGAGKYSTYENVNPTLNVANANATMIIQDIFGMLPDEDETEDDYEGLVGVIPNEKLPEMKRRLIKLKNTDQSSLTKDKSEYGGAAYMDKTGERPEIKTRARIIDMGRTSTQVSRYIDTLIQIIDAAQKEGGALGWS